MKCRAYPVPSEGEISLALLPNERRRPLRMREQKLGMRCCYS